MKPAVGANQPTLATFQNCTAIHTILPIVRGIRVADPTLDILRLRMLLILHSERYARCYRLSRIKAMLTLPRKPHQCYAHGFHRPDHIVGFLLGCHLRDVEG
jgi:hypothetical protein